ncbi:MAG: methyltransferase domain-containing protein, partial [Chthoniobacteraceae bacterium]
MSADVIRERYDAAPYRHGAVPDSHPARVGAIARLLGIPAVPPDRCRVLELGCGEGMNLLPLAERFPKSEFVGVDFSAKQIATAEAARAACGIGNARFVFADLRTWKRDGGTFDYVIAHGVYSWVTEEVRERLLALCAEALSPCGVAYVS